MYTTLLTGLEVLERVAASSQPRGVTELAAELKLPKSNVHRMLQTLVNAGYVRQSEGSQYLCTLKVWELGAQVVEGMDVLREGRVQMRKLSELTQEMIHFAILDQGEVSYIDLVESQLPVRVHLAIGQRAPAHAVSTGKAMLAFSPDKTVAQACKRLVRYTSSTETDAVGFGASLARIRAAGYAISRGEYREGVAGIGVPIFDRDGRVTAALGISGPSERLTESKLRRLAPVAIACANRVSESLGYRPRTNVRAA